MKTSFYLLLFSFSILIVSCSGEPTESDNHSTDPPKEAVESKQLDFSELVDKDYGMDATHSYLGFKIQYFGNSPVRGRFDRFDGTLFYDPEYLGSTSARVIVDVSTINTGNERRDGHLTEGESWFNVQEFPEASFVSTSCIPHEDGSFDLVGEFTMRGTTVTDTMMFEVPTPITRDWAGNEQVDFSGKMTVNRQIFGVYGSDFWSSVMENGLTQLSDDVVLELDIHCRRPDYAQRYLDADSTDFDKLVLDAIKADGIEQGLMMIDTSFAAGNLRGHTLASIGSTLNAWEMHDLAHTMFEKSLQLFPDRSRVNNQMAITHLFQGEMEIAKEHFKETLAADSSDTRALEYLRRMRTVN